MGSGEGTHGGGSVCVATIDGGVAAAGAYLGRLRHGEGWQQRWVYIGSGAATQGQGGWVTLAVGSGTSGAGGELTLRSGRTTSTGAIIVASGKVQLHRVVVCSFRLPMRVMWDLVASFF